MTTTTYIDHPSWNQPLTARFEREVAARSRSIRTWVLALVAGSLVAVAMAIGALALGAPAHGSNLGPAGTTGPVGVSTVSQSLPGTTGPIS